MRSKNRIIILVTVKLVLSLPILIVLVVILHEGAHFVTALIMGVPISHFNWFDPYYLAPVLTSGSTGYPMETKIISYAGGLVTGMLLLAVLIMKRGWCKQSLYKWFIGLSIATLGFWQISHGVLEGAFHQKYISDVTNLFSSSYYIGYASGLFGMALYWVSMHGFKELLVKEIRNCDTSLKHT